MLEATRSQYRDMFSFRAIAVELYLDVRFVRRYFRSWMYYGYF